MELALRILVTVAVLSAPLAIISSTIMDHTDSYYDFWEFCLAVSIFIMISFAALVGIGLIIAIVIAIWTVPV